jgi:TonB family protein
VSISLKIMNSFVLYRPSRRRHTYLAFACAAAIHLTAVALARNRSEIAAAEVTTLDPVIGIDPPMEERPRPDQDAITPPTTVPTQEFTEESATPLPIRQTISVAPVTRSRPSGPAHIGSMRALLLYAPRPDYPYVARRDRITGSGVALATIDPAGGAVLDVHMARSTGSLILDNSTIFALRRWRFRPGTASSILVPITFTLSGASY